MGKRVLCVRQGRQRGDLKLLFDPREQAEEEEKKKYLPCQRWQCTPLVPALEGQRQADLCQLQASLLYKFRTVRATRYMEKPCLGEKEKKKSILLLSLFSFCHTRLPQDSL